MPTILGVNFGREFFGGRGLKPWRNKAEKFAGKKSLEEFAERFAGKSPKFRQTKLESSPQIRSAEPRDQGIKTFSGQFHSAGAPPEAFASVCCCV